MEPAPSHHPDDSTADVAPTAPLDAPGDDWAANSTILDRAGKLFEAPKQIGPYHILELLGAGGMGEVYKAERRSPMRQIVAIKIIKLGFDTREVLARFESERQALARMNHPHIAKVLDAGTTDTGRPYFVMEYFAGETITRFADDNKLTIKDRLLLFTQACDAIAHAHTKAIIHRDIKAGNVLACMHDGKPMAKVIDFGIAKALTGDRLTDATFNTDRGHIVGTYDSMSPEQAQGSADIDTRTDVYSLGVLLYELLTGAMPFDHETLARAADDEIRRIIREVEPPRPSTRLTSLGGSATKIAAMRCQQLDALAKQLRSELEWIPLKAMRKERNRRYVSAQQFAEDIQNYLNQRPLIAGPESRVYKLQKFGKRNRAALIVTAVLLAAVAFGVVQLIRAEIAEQNATEEKQKRELAEATLASTLDKNKEVLDGAQKELARSNDAALSRIEQGKVAQAASELRLACSQAERQLGPNDPLTLRLMHNLAIALQIQGKEKYPEAEALYRETLRRRRGVLGDEARETLVSINSLGVLLRAQKQYAQAEPLFREALAARQRLDGPDSRDAIISAHDLGSLLRLQEKFAEAEPLLRRALDWRRQNLPAGHPYTLDSLYSYGLLLQQTNRLSEAAPLSRELYQYAPEAQVPPRQTAVYMSCYGIALHKLGRYSEAEEPLLEAHRRLVDANQQTHPAFRDVVAALADTYENTGRTAEATKWRAELENLEAGTSPSSGSSTPADVRSAKPPG